MTVPEVEIALLPLNYGVSSSFPLGQLRLHPGSEGAGSLITAG